MIPIKQTRVSNPQPLVDVYERKLRGSEIGLPMVDSIAVTVNFKAERISWHSHEQHEVLLLLRGSTEYEFSDGRRVALAGGQYMVVPPRMLHRGFKDIRGPSLLCAVVFDPSQTRGRQSPFTKNEMTWLAAQFETPEPVAHPMNATLQRMAHRFHQDIRQYPSRQASVYILASTRLQMAAILLEVARQSGATDKKYQSTPVAIATAHMEREFAGPIQMNDLATRAGCSRSRFFAVFKSETGMSPNDWLQRFRIRKASDLLTTTDRSLIDIALSVGFESQQYFCHIFRKYMRKTPGEYRSASS